MAYALPRFAWLNATADSVAAGGIVRVTVSVAVNADAVFAKDHLADYRPNTLMRLAAAQTQFDTTLDRGSAGLEAVDRLLIPVGHNLGAATLTVHSSTTGAFGGEEVSRGSVAAPGAGTVDLALTSTTDRFLRLRVAGGSLVYEYGELYFSRVRTATLRSWAPDYQDLQVPRQVRTETATGLVVLQFGSARSTVGGTFEKIGPPDLAFFDELLAHTLRGLPFWYWRPDSAAVPILVLGEFTRREQSRPNPSAIGEGFSFDLTLRELG